MKKEEIQTELKNAKDSLFEAVRQRDREGYKERSREYIQCIQKAYGVMKDVAIFRYHTKVRNRIKKISKENGHLVPWNLSHNK